MSSLNVIHDQKRRSFLKLGAAAALSLPLPIIFTSRARAYTNEPNGREVVFGFNVPQTGAYADTGADELRAFALAVKHLNGDGDGGMLNTFSSSALQGNGVNGKKVAFVTGDTQTKSDAAHASTKRMIEKDGAIMISGGVSTGTALAMQQACEAAGIVNMAGVLQGSRFTNDFAFRHFLDAEISAAALAPTLSAQFGTNRSVYHITSDYLSGYVLEEANTRSTENLGWRTVGSSAVPLGSADVSSAITDFLNKRADVIYINQYERALANTLVEIDKFGLRSQRINGNEPLIVAPLLTRYVAKAAGDYIQGVIGTVNWDWTLQGEGSSAFVRSFGAEYGIPPTQAAHTCYCQTLLYADAAQRAGTFDPVGVREALLGTPFQGLGTGQSFFRREDHQCVKDVFVVEGKQHQSSDFAFYNILNICPSCGTNGPETCSKNACAQGYECCSGTCKKKC